MSLSDNARNALSQAYAKRGAHRGQLLTKCPRSTTLAAAAWQGAMLSCNPYKASVATQLFFSAEQREIAQEITAHFDTLPKAYRIMAQRDRDTLERLGVW